MNRYNVITNKFPREIVLLRSYPCKWGRCFFCDYIDDNMSNEDAMIAENKAILEHVKGTYGVLEVINSASVFELPRGTWAHIKETCEAKGIHTVAFEAYYNYKERLQEVRDFFAPLEVTFKCGVESFDEEFRNGYLQKNIHFTSPQEVADHFDTICLLVGIKGQTREMIDEDIRIGKAYFKRLCINVFVNNTTLVKRDDELVAYLEEHYRHLDDDPQVEMLWHNTDFGVGD